MIYLYMLAAGFYSASEAGVGCWFVNYMSESFYMGAEERALYASLFSFSKPSDWYSAALSSDI